ncbi:MAG: hypothetical protein LQ348_002144 [Seirophora lacunosa]|nr:MAG: hypothetical protein LQ348_002144 [Seirophora lacunosa]
MPPIATDSTFTSLLAFKAALRAWAIERNFTPHILDSDSHRVRAGCRSGPNCPFRIRCNWNEKQRIAKVTTCEDVHNCVTSTTNSIVHQDIKRAEAGRLKFLLEVVPQLLDVTVTTTTTSIIDAVQARYGQKIPLRQAQKVKRELAGRIHGPCRYCRTEGHSRRNCPTRKEREASGIMAPPTPEEMATQGISPQYLHFANPNMAPNGSQSYHHHPPGERRCTLCLQLGHNRGNCPTRENTPNNHILASQTSYRDERPSQPSAYSIPHDTVGQDDAYSQSEPPTSNHPPQTHESLTPQPHIDPALELREPPQLTPREIQAEAARLMQEAARLMNEAAMMNAEAARLTASIKV